MGPEKSDGKERADDGFSEIEIESSQADHLLGEHRDQASTAGEIDTT